MNDRLAAIAHMTTFTKRRVNLLDLRVEDICIEDVAHHLACTNRFNGALIYPVSVAQHSVYVSKLCEGTGYELEGLLHDGAEAFVGDVTKWLKESDEMAAFRVVEDRVQELVYQAFGISIADIAAPAMMHPEVKAADMLMVRYEAMQSGFSIPHPDYPKSISIDEFQRIGQWRPWNWKNAERAFLKRFFALHPRKIIIES
jgi:hypothetical protein